MILKPNGQFFFYSFLTKKQIVRMLNLDWNKYIRDYNVVMKNKDIYSMQFINEMYSEEEKDEKELFEQLIKQSYTNSSVFSQSTNKPRRIVVKKPYICFGYASY